jgi:aryl-alcohol dehydrogenase-like predicted oxidoreductase
LALAWVLKQPTVVSMIMGASSPDQIRENVKIPEVPQHVLDAATQATEKLKQKLGSNPDMWARTSRYL